MAINDITGDALVSRAPSEAYKNNYDLIFGKKKDVADKGQKVMPTDYVIELAKEAGLLNQHNEDLIQDKVVMAQFERFFSLARTKALEEAAKICLETGIKHPDQTGQEACAAAIRSLK